MVRLKDIAAQAGVSVMTVSKALRDEPDISAATKARIRVLAQQLGYVPDSSAQGLRTRTTRLLGVAIPAATDPFLARAVLAIEDAAHQMGYDILLAHTLNSSEREEYCLRRFMSRRVDGLFVAPVYRLTSESRVYRELQERGIPTVILGQRAAFCADFPAVYGDDLLSSYAATQHLLKLGHRRIAYLTGPLPASWAHERFEGYRRALREAGVEADERLVFQAGFSYEEGVKAVSQLIQEKCGATAIQAVNDPVALACMQGLLQQGITIPAEVSVMGYGNITFSDHFQVPLSTVNHPKYRLGSAAAAIMQQLLKGNRADVRPIPAELIIRASTGTAPASSRLG